MSGLPARRPLFLRNSADIERVKQNGRRVSTPLFNLVSYMSGLHRIRVGVIVGKRFGKAVMRNRAKRVFRELARQTEDHCRMGYDLLIFPRREALTIRHARLRDAWIAALKAEGLLASHMDFSCDESVSG
jgi:ribonuclease P protein component